MVFKYKSIKDFFFSCNFSIQCSKVKANSTSATANAAKSGLFLQRLCSQRITHLYLYHLPASGTWSSLVFWSLTRRHCYVGIWTAHRFTQTILNLLSFSHQEVRSLWNLFTSKQWECLLISLSGDPATLHEQMNLLLNQISGQQMPVLAPCSKTSQPKPCTTIYSLIFITNP